MNKFTRGVAVVLAGVMLLTASGVTLGMGFGRPVSRALLGDSLTVSVPVRLETGEELDPECVKADVYYGDDKVNGQAVQAQLQSGNGRDRTIVIRSTALINEPVVTYYVVAGCQPRITRKFVVLVDPPDVSRPVVQPELNHTLAEGPKTAPATPIALVQDASSQVSILGAKASSFSLSGQPGKTSKRQKKHDRALAKRDGGKRSLASSRERPAPREVAKLVLDPVEMDATVNPGLQMSSGMASVSTQADEASPDVMQRRRQAGAIWQAMNATPEQLARDRDRLQELESKLDALRVDSARASEAVTGLQAKVAGRDGGGSTLVYGLGALAAMLLGVLAWREWTLRKALADRATWWPSNEPEAAALPLDQSPPSDSLLDEGEDSRPSLPDVLETAEDVPAEPYVSPVLAPLGAPPETASQPIVELMPSYPSATPKTPVRHDSLRAVSVDELIDLEQQAEFFVVLGQDDSAIDVLETYIRTTTAASPMPFLKLLEVYRRLDLRSAYERTRMNFNLRFNAHAPGWDADMSHGHELADYPGIIERLQALWAHPVNALEVLERSLMRQDNESYTFDLPAYRELLFLYSVARDLSERPASLDPQARALTSAQVLAESGESWTATQPSPDLDVVSPLMATLPMKALPELAPVLSLDLELDDLVAEPVPQPEKAPAIKREPMERVDCHTLEYEHITLPVDEGHNP